MAASRPSPDKGAISLVSPETRGQARLQGGFWPSWRLSHKTFKYLFYSKLGGYQWAIG